MSGVEKTHRPERELAERDPATPVARAKPTPTASADDTSGQQARLWRELGASRAPRDQEDAANLAVEHRGSGRGVDPGIAGKVGAHMGANLDGVRVHSDPLSQQSTRAMGARAFAYGNDVFLGPGESPADTGLMAHELAHVAQQRGGAATPQMKISIGGVLDAAEAEADAIAAKVVGGTQAVVDVLSDGGALNPGQLVKQAFLAQLKPLVVAAADQELGKAGAAEGCPYIETYFAKYSAMPAAQTLALLRKWIPSAASVTSATDLVPMVVARVRSGIKTWKETGALPPELAAADPGIAAAARASSTPGAPTAQRKSLDALESDLGAGEAVDSKLAGPLGAQGARIHRGPVAAQHARAENAVAFAVGQNVVMGAGAPQQGTPAGDALLAHELAHTAQQKDAAGDATARMKPIGAEDHGAERDADRAASGAISGQRVATLGNFAGAIGDVMRTGLQLQRCASDTSVDRFAYYKKYEIDIANDAASTIRQMPFGTTDSTIAWSGGGQKAFAGHLADQVAAPSTAASLEALVRPERMSSLIDSSRLLNEAGSAKGPDQYFHAVGVEVANALARRTAESLGRELPRYAQAKLAGGGEPKADSIAVSHPIDPLVVSALTMAPIVTIDGAGFRSAHPELAGAPRHIDQTRNVVTEKVGETGMWYRLKEPMDATVEEIANALLGAPTEAYRVTNAHPLYGVDKQNNDEFYGSPGTSSAANQLLVNEPTLRDEAALSQAGGGKPSRSGAKILEQMRLNATLLGKSIYGNAIKFGPDVADVLVAAAQRINDRAAQLSLAKEPDIQKWDAQVTQQQDLLGKGSRGLQADVLRLQMYATQFDTKLGEDPGANKLPDEHRNALHEDVSLWCQALAMTDMVASATAALQTAARHSATLETQILERQLDIAQSASYAAKDSGTTKSDTNVDSLPSRELEARQKLAAVRAQALTDPSAMTDPKTIALNADASQNARDLVFESSVIAQAAQLDAAWKMLDDMDGTLSNLTGDHGDLAALKSEGKRYYVRWTNIYSQITKIPRDPAAAKTAKANARQDYEKLVATPDFQTFMNRVQTLVKDTQKHHLIATIIATVVITVVTMGAGLVVEGLVGGGAVAAEVADGVEVTTEVASAARNARIAGMVANAATGAVLNQLIFAKSVTIKGIAADFGRNMLLFGAFKMVSAGFKMAGLAKIAEAGLKPGATAADVMKGGGVMIGEAVLNGGVGALEALCEAKLSQAMGGKPLTQEEAESIVLHNVVQMVGLAMFSRFMNSPMQALKIKAAFQGQNWRRAVALRSANRSAMTALGAGEHTSTEIVAAAKKESQLIEVETQALEELKAQGDKALEGTGYTEARLDGQIATLKGYGAKARGFQFAFGMTEVGDGLYTAPRAQVADMMNAQAGILEKPPTVESKDPSTGARTWVLQPKDGDAFRVQEEMPEWSYKTAAGKELVQVIERNPGMAWVFEAPQAQIDAMVDYQRTLSTNDPKAVAAADQRLSKAITKNQFEEVSAAIKAFARWQSAADQADERQALIDGKPLDAAQREHLEAELRRQVPDIRLMDAVQNRGAKTVLSVLVPGGGESGIKAMNDDMIGYGMNSGSLIPARNRIISDAFSRQGFEIVDQGYKMTTLTTTMPAEQTAGKIRIALAEIDQGMKPLLMRVLGDGIAHFTVEKSQLSPKDPNYAVYEKRIAKMTALRAKIASNPDFHFDFHIGESEIAGAGPGQKPDYAAVLAAEMDASKAAIMARDAKVTSGRTADTDGRAMVYSKATFITFCKETVALKAKLAGAELPYEGRVVRVFAGDGEINHDLLRAIRKQSYKEKLSAAQSKILEDLGQYITRVNSFDYVKQFTGDEVANQGTEVDETAALIKKLQSGEPIDRDTAAKIDQVLRGSNGIAQQDAGSEAQYFAKAAKLQNRIVLNADIKDMGLDLFDGYAKTMDSVGSGKATNLDAASASASDPIVEFKRHASEDFVRYYKTDLMTKARNLAQPREDGRVLLDALDRETEPVLLLGGDEVTVSLGSVFEELGLVPEIVAKLTDPKVANARVAVTRTGAGDGAAEHELAMDRGNAGQGLLKKTAEPYARSLDTAAKSLSGDQAAQAHALVDLFNGMYTVEQDGQPVLVDKTGTPVDWPAVQKRAAGLIKAGGGEVPH